MKILMFLLPFCVAQPCNRCGYRPPYQGYVQPQPLPQPLPRPTVQEYYYTNSYATAPLPPPPPQVLASLDKDLTTPEPDAAAKLLEYEKFEQKLAQLKPGPEAILPEPERNITSTTYIREYPAPSPTYYARPMPYRPLPYPRGCPVVYPPQPAYRAYQHPLPYQAQGYVTPPVAPIHPPPPPQTPRYVPPLNDCCGRCNSPCRYSSYARPFLAHAQGSKTVPKSGEKESKESEPKLRDSRCTDEKLKVIMQEMITTSPSASKRRIQKMAEEKLGGYFSVICSRDDFSYVARTETFCQLAKDETICYAFLHH